MHTFSLKTFRLPIPTSNTAKSILRCITSFWFRIRTKGSPLSKTFYPPDIRCRPSRSWGAKWCTFPSSCKLRLGHEITHQWFGNYVFADFAKGNWLEGITTYLADHRYEELKGQGWEYRKKILADYQSYVTPEKEFPLRDFVGRTGFASMAIGYGKAAMLFHMLRTLVGEEAFYSTLRKFIEKNKFREATWEDIRASFRSNLRRRPGLVFQPVARPKRDPFPRGRWMPGR